MTNEDYVRAVRRYYQTISDEDLAQHIYQLGWIAEWQPWADRAMPLREARYEQERRRAQEALP